MSCFHQSMRLLKLMILCHYRGVWHNRGARCANNNEWGKIFLYIYISTTASSIRRVLHQQALDKNVLIETTTKPTIRAHFPQLSLDTKINASLSSHKTSLITAVNYIFIEIFGAWIRLFLFFAHISTISPFFCWNTLREKANGRCSGKKAPLI